MSESDKTAIVNDLAQQVEAMLRKKSTRLLVYRMLVMAALIVGGWLAVEVRVMVKTLLGMPVKVSEHGVIIDHLSTDVATHERRLNMADVFQATTSQRLQSLERH
jgi:hypothetical protein